MKILLGAASIVGGGLGWYSAAQYGDWSFIPLLGGGLLLTYCAMMIEDRYSVIQRIVLLISFAISTSGMTGFIAALILNWFDALPAPQAAFFYGAGIVVVGILALWISDVVDSSRG